jgi:hypothetical protein
MLSEWWTYRPSDFLMFSPRIHARLFESVNLQWWPLALLLPLAGLAWAWLLWRRGAALRPGLAALGVVWIFVAWTFHAERFVPINWAAVAFVLLFALQGVGLLGLAALGGVQVQRHGARAAIGLALWLLALLAHPLLAALLDRPWLQAEVFGLAPDPTAIATLGVWLLLRADSRAGVWAWRVLGTLPLVWCGISAALLATMDSGQAWVPAAAALLTLAALALPPRR